MPRPFLLAIGGHVGTGKTTLAHELRKRCSFLQKAEIVEDDHARRLFLGRSLSDPMHPDDYSESISVAVRKMLDKQVEMALKKGCPVIDCSGFFSEKGQEAIEQLAQNCAVPFVGLWLTASETILIERLKKRAEERASVAVLLLENGHASDADSTVLDKFGSLPMPQSTAWCHLSADRPLTIVVDEAIRLICQ